MHAKSHWNPPICGWERAIFGWPWSTPGVKNVKMNAKEHFHRQYWSNTILWVCLRHFWHIEKLHIFDVIGRRIFGNRHFDFDMFELYFSGGKIVTKASTFKSRRTYYIISKQCQDLLKFDFEKIVLQHTYNFGFF